MKVAPTWLGEGDEEGTEVVFAVNDPREGEELRVKRRVVTGEDEAGIRVGDHKADAESA